MKVNKFDSTINKVPSAFLKNGEWISNLQIFMDFNCYTHHFKRVFLGLNFMYINK